MSLESTLSFESHSEFPRLLNAGRRGNPAAQATLYRRYFAQVERIAHAQLRRAAGGRGTSLSARFSTADVVQDAFLALFDHLHAFAGSSEGEFVNYLATLVRNRALQAVRFHQATRRDWRRQYNSLESFAPDLLAVLPDASLAMNDPARHSEIEALYRSALDSLPAHERQVLRARIEFGLGFTALAEQLGYPSRYAARRAFFAAQARLILRLKRAGVQHQALQ